MHAKDTTVSESSYGLGNFGAINAATTACGRLLIKNNI